MATYLNNLQLGLPIEAVIPSVKLHFLSHDTLVLGADPGAGKSTLLPLHLVHEPWLEGKKIILLEPRRLAAMSVARRMSDLLGQELGETVGYRIRFDKKVGVRTRIEVVTEGILTSMLQHDNALEGVGLVIFDEFHERRIHADLSLALCREAQQILRPDLRILVMSATLDLDKLAKLLDTTIVSCKGRPFQVDVQYEGNLLLDDLAQRCARLVRRALSETTGDMLVFLPGQAEIGACKQLLEKQVQQVDIHALYGQLSMREQQAAIVPGREGRRKVVLSTSIAETSLTIEGVKVVVDSGFTRQQLFDVRSGLSQLRTLPISKDIAAQRCGRAGRLGPGICYRMWSAADEERMKDFITPEILEADLLPLTLELTHWGVSDAQTLTWLSPPPQHRLQQATETLAALGAVEQQHITAHGKKMATLPCHPRIAHMLLTVADSPLLSVATDLAALLEERDPLPQAPSVDISLRVDQLRKCRKDGKLGPFQKIAHAASFYRRLFGLPERNDGVNPYDCGLLLSYVYPERLAQAFAGMTGRFKMANGHMAVVAAQDDLAHEAWIAIAQVDARKGDGKVFLAAPIAAEQVRQLAVMSEQVRWDVRKGGFVARREWRIGGLIADTKPMGQVQEELVTKSILDAVRSHAAELLDLNDSFVQWQNRVGALRIWNGDDRWPEVGIDALASLAHEWLAPYLQGVRKNEELKRLNLQELLTHWLPYELQQALDALAPEKIGVPSGSHMALHYRPDGEMPILAVRLQEIFGLLDTPRINNGKNKVLLHLLSPGFKPVQVTTDLRSFWQDTYFEVRKELKRRYPKHEWPENPLEAAPVRGVVRRK